MRYKSVVGQIVSVREVFAASSMAWIALLIEFDFQGTFLRIEFALGMATEVKVTAMRDPFEFTVFTRW
jgi:hypothetical protein